MSDTTDQTVVYLKEKCPFCMKVRIALLEAGLQGKVQVRDFVPGDDEEKAIRAELEPNLEKVSFPAARIDGAYIADSDAIVGRLLDKAGKDVSGMTVLKAYVEGPFQRLLELYRENGELKKQLSA